MNRRPLLSLGALLLLLLTACRTAPTVRGREMYELGSALTMLSAAVEAEVRYGDAPADISDEELIQRATKHDPGLVAPFSGYVLRVARENRHAIVLVCTKDRVALLEDAGCSAPMDRHLWDSSPAKPCEFTIRVGDACR